MPTRILVDNVQDMRGGLNLRADPFELGDNESPDLLNVDLDPRGGVEQRKGTSSVPVVLLNPNQFSHDSATHEQNVGWGAPVNCTVAQSTVDPLEGTHCMLLTSSGPGTCEVTDGAGGMHVLAGLSYTAFIHVKSVSVARNVQLKINWFTSAAAFISATTGVSTATTTSGWTIVSVTGTAPAGAALADVVIDVLATTSGEQFRVDKNQFSLGGNPNLWLDPSLLTALDSEVQTLIHFKTETLSQLVASTAAGFWWSYLGTNQWSAIGAASPSHAVQFKDKLYLTALDGSYSWDGSAVAGLHLGTFNDNLTTPTNSFLPKAKYITAFQGSVWVAHTSESDGLHQNRVRFSHPNFPADYRSFDYIDVDTGLDGDEITGLVPFGDRLLIFKHRSVYAISGTGPDDFQVYPVTREVGALAQRAIASTDMGVFFFSWPEGVFLYDGKSVQRQSERIHPLIDEGMVPASKQSLIRLGWSNHRLWVTVPWRALAADPVPTANTRTYVLDPTLTKQGSWTVYDVAVGTMVNLPLSSNSLQFVGATPNQGYLLLLEDPTLDQTYDLLPTGIRKAITSYYRTRWVDLKQPAQKKRWKRPEFVIHSLNAQAALPVQVFTDYDPVAVKHTFNITTSQDASVMLWGDNWGETWDLGEHRSTRSEVVRGSAPGLARAVQLKINGPDPLSFNLLTPDESRFEGTDLLWLNAFPPPNDSTLVLSSGQVFEGTKSLLVTANGPTTSSGAMLNRKLPVEPGRTVVWSVAFRAKDVSAESLPSISFFDANGVSVGTAWTRTVFDTTTGWTVISVQAVVPVGASLARPYVQWIGSLTAGQGHYIDYAEFYAADDPVGLAWGLNAIAFKYVPRPVRS